MSNSGNTLAEVLISALLAGILSTSVLAMALNSRQTSGRLTRRRAAALSGQRVLDALKAYVTADPSVLRGPGTGLDGWQLPGDACGCYALQPGSTHALDASLWLPELARYNGRISYTVNGPLDPVALSIDWKEP